MNMGDDLVSPNYDWRGWSRISTARACASKPSVRARRAAIGPICARRLDDRPITLTILMKSATESGDAKRAVRPVGITWLGPAT